MTKGTDRIQALLVFTALACLHAATPASASYWCGDNGVVRFSFAEGDSLVSILESGEPENGVTVVDLYAWLTDVDPVSRDGEAFLRVGGIEMKLDITGAEGFVIGQDFPSEALNVGQGTGSLAVGYVPGQRLNRGKALLVHWRVMFQGRPENVRFGLDPTGMVSCGDLPGCGESGTQALYVGVMGSNLLEAMVGAGYVPAWLNPVGEPDLTPITGRQSWRDVGVFSER